MPEIPNNYMKLCREWHNGQSSIMYAISSTGELTLGTDRPKHEDEDRFMTDNEWMLYLWQCLEIEIRDSIKTATKFRDQSQLTKFLVWTKGIISSLEEKRV